MGTGKGKRGSEKERGKGREKGGKGKVKKHKKNLLKKCLKNLGWTLKLTFLVFTYIYR